MQKMECGPAIQVEGPGPADQPQDAETDIQPPTQEERALITAIRQNDVQTVHTFITRLPEDFDINSSINGTTPVTPLCLAATLGLSDLCRMLLAIKLVDQNQPNPQGETPLLLAIKNSKWDIAALLLESEADPNKPKPLGSIGTPLFNAVWRGRSKMVRLLVQHGANINVGSCRSTPLFMAARLGCLEITKILLDAGCDKDLQNRAGTTALAEAVLRCHVNIVRVLLDCGCDPNMADTYGLTPLHIVAQNLTPCDESKTILKLLIDGGADVTLVNSKGDTAADIAISGTRDWVLNPILDKGAALNLMVHRRDALTRVLQNGELDIAEILMKAHPFHTVEPSGDVVVTLTGHSQFAILLILSGIEDSPLIYSDNIQNDEHREFLRKIFIKPLSLQIYCRTRLRRYFGLRTLYVVKALKLPKKIEDFLLLNDLGVGFSPDQGSFYGEVLSRGYGNRRAGGSLGSALRSFMAGRMIAGNQ